jgi:hypothetical protein
MTDEELLVAVVSLIAREMGEDPGALPSRERHVINCQIGISLISAACNHSADSIRAFVNDILKAPSKTIAIDSV